MKFFWHLRELLFNKTEISKDIYALFKLEAKLAGLNIAPLLIGLVALFSLSIILWLTAMVLIGYLIMMLTKLPLAAIITVLIINLGFLFYLVRDVKQRLQQMSFAKTRDCLREPEVEKESEPRKEKAIASYQHLRDKG